MKSVGQIIKENYHFSKSKLEQDYSLVLEKNPTFKKLVTSLNLPDSYLMKYTTALEESAEELNHCKKCQNILECKNSYTGHVIYPNILNDNLKLYLKDNVYRVYGKTKEIYIYYLQLFYGV